MDMDTERRMARLEEQVAMLCRHLGLNGTEKYMPPPPLLPPPPGGPEDFVPGARPAAVPGAQDPRLPPAFFTALENQKLIQAIKIYREATGAGLKEAKDRVDEMAGRRKRR
jgi:hypothetical protein